MRRETCGFCKILYAFERTHKSTCEIFLSSPNHSVHFMDERCMQSYVLMLFKCSALGKFLAKYRQITCARVVRNAYENHRSSLVNFIYLRLMKKWDNWNLMLQN